MFDSELFKSKDMDNGDPTCSVIAADMGFGYYSTECAIRKDAPGSTPIGLTDDTYSSLSVIPSPYGGQLFIFGGSASSLSFDQVSVLADYIVCGITSETVVLETHYGEKGYGDMFATMPPIDRGDLFYLRIGKPLTNVGVAVEL